MALSADLTGFSACWISLPIAILDGRVCRLRLVAPMLLQFHMRKPEDDFEDEIALNSLSPNRHTLTKGMKPTSPFLFLGLAKNDQIKKLIPSEGEEKIFKL